VVVHVPGIGERLADVLRALQGSARYPNDRPLRSLGALLPKTGQPPVTDMTPKGNRRASQEAFTYPYGTGSRQDTCALIEVYVLALFGCHHANEGSYSHRGSPCLQNRPSRPSGTLGA